MISVKTGGKDLLDSKTFLSIGLGETTVTIGQGNEALKFVLDFVTSEEPDSKIAFEPIDEKSLRIRLTNWKNSLGQTLTEPVPVGQFSKRKLYLLFSISKIGSKAELREITFSAYLGEEVKDGQD